MTVAAKQMCDNTVDSLLRAPTTVTDARQRRAAGARYFRAGPTNS